MILTATRLKEKELYTSTSKLLLTIYFCIWKMRSKKLTIRQIRGLPHVRAFTNTMTSRF